MNWADALIILSFIIFAPMIIYHNPRCSKSRETLDILREKGIEPEIVEYLKNPPTPAELRSLLKKLGLKPLDIIRTSEEYYKTELKGRDLSDEEWILAMASHPELIERPIVVEGNKAILGRPPQKVLELC